MPDAKRISLTLTKEQRDAVKAACGKDGEVMELTAEELEERIAPSLLVRGMPTELDGAPIAPEGSATIVPHDSINLDGVDARFDGTYHVEPVDQSPDAESGYKEQFKTDREA